MAVFSGPVSTGDVANQNVFNASLDTRVDFQQPLIGSNIGVLVGLSYGVSGSIVIGDLTRTVKCNGTAMNSLGVIAWNAVTHGGWTEVFGLANVAATAKPAAISATVVGGTEIFGNQLPRTIRGSSLAFTGVDSFGTVTTASGTGTSLSVAGNGSAASKVAAFFGAQAGLSAVNKTQRYLQNAAIALAISEAQGTGSSDSFTATRGASGTWSAISVVVNPAATVASVKTLVAIPNMGISTSRLPRPTGPRRIIFDVQPED